MFYRTSVDLRQEDDYAVGQAPVEATMAYSERGFRRLDVVSHHVRSGFPFAQVPSHLEL
jgi:hypothetical protein